MYYTIDIYCSLSFSYSHTMYLNIRHHVQSKCTIIFILHLKKLKNR